VIDPRDDYDPANEACDRCGEEHSGACVTCQWCGEAHGDHECDPDTRWHFMREHTDTADDGGFDAHQEYERQERGR
jgi:hypothetical protein